MTTPIAWNGFRYEPVAAMYDVGVCASAETCPKKISEYRHHFGYADNQGTIHWNSWPETSPRKRGLHKLLCLIAVVKLKHHRRPGMPKWQALHETETWAQREAISKFHIKFPETYNHKAREAAWADFQRHRPPVALVDSAAYQWMRYPQMRAAKKERDNE